MAEWFARSAQSNRRPIPRRLTVSTPQYPLSEAPTQFWHRAQPRPRRRLGPVLLVVAVLLLMLTMAAAGVGLGLWVESDRIMPGVSVMGLDLGGRSTSEAITILRARWQQQSISLFAGQSSWQVSPVDLGMTLDAATSVQQAYRQGRSMSSLELALRSGGRVGLPPIWSYDAYTAEAALQALALEFDRPPLDATMTIEAGRAVALPSALGRKLDVAATLNILDQDPAQVLSAGSLPLVITPWAPRVDDISTVVTVLNELLETTVTIRAIDPITGEHTEGLVIPDVWSQWLNVEVTDPRRGEFTWSLDDQQLRAYLVGQAGALGADRFLDLDQAAEAVTEAISSSSGQATVRVYHHEREHVVEPGDTLAGIGRRYGVPYPWIQQANPNVGDTLYTGQRILIPSPDKLLPLPVVAGKRIVVSISQQRVWVYENGQSKWEWLASTGIDASPTAPGVFQIQSHEANAYAGNWNLWMPHFMGVYRPVPDSDFMNGFHGFPTRNGSTLLWTGDLGHPVTYGCILLSSENAATLYQWAEEGVVVEIRL